MLKSDWRYLDDFGACALNYGLMNFFLPIVINFLWYPAFCPPPGGHLAADLGLYLPSGTREDAAAQPGDTFQAHHAQVRARGPRLALTQAAETPGQHDG